MNAATLMCATFEAMGILVHRRIALFPLVQELIGGITVVMWLRLKPWIVQLRVEQSNPSDSQWFQLLAEELELRKPEKVPACDRHGDWAP